ARATSATATSASFDGPRSVRSLGPESSHPVSGWSVMRPTTVPAPGRASIVFPAYGRFGPPGGTARDALDHAGVPAHDHGHPPARPERVRQQRGGDVRGGVVPPGQLRPGGRTGRPAGVGPGPPRRAGGRPG